MRLERKKWEDTGRGGDLTSGFYDSSRSWTAEVQKKTIPVRGVACTSVPLLVPVALVPNSPPTPSLLPITAVLLRWP